MYKIEYSKKAKKFMNCLEKNERIKIEKEIELIAENPIKYGIIKLKNTDPSEYRARQGNYRILFSVHHEILLVEIIQIDDRKNMYRK